MTIIRTSTLLSVVTLIYLTSTGYMTANGDTSVACSDWKILIDKKKAIIDKFTYGIIAEQYDAYTKGTAPKIADQIIKAIPIIESHESLVDLNQINIARIAMLPAPNYAFASPDCHSGFDASSKIRQAMLVKLQALVVNLDMFAKNFGYEAGQVDIKVFEGLRTLSTQQMLFDNKAKEIKAAHPLMSDCEVAAETSKWVSPYKNNTPVHSTGGAIDIRLWDNKRKLFLDMGNFGVIWGENKNAPLFSRDLTETQKNNRLYLLIAATQAGLINYLYEYWHFSSGDRYASFWLEPDAARRKAIYDAVS